MKIRVCDICLGSLDTGTITIRARQLMPGGGSEPSGYWETIEVCPDCKLKVREFVTEARKLRQEVKK